MSHIFKKGRAEALPFSFYYAKVCFADFDDVDFEQSFSLATRRCSYLHRVGENGKICQNIQVKI